MSVSEQASRSRQELGDCVAELGQLAEVAKSRGGLVRGSLYEFRRRCGKAGCRCSRGGLHSGRALGVSAGGWARPVSLKGIDVATLSDHVEAYRRVRKARAEMVKVFAKLLATADRLEHLREIPVSQLRQQGQAKA